MMILKNHHWKLHKKNLPKSTIFTKSGVSSFSLGDKITKRQMNFARVL